MRYQRQQTTFKFARHALHLTIEGQAVTLPVSEEMRGIFADMAREMGDASKQQDITDSALDALCTRYLDRLLPADTCDAILAHAQDAGDKLELLCFLAHAFRGYNAARVRRLTRYDAKGQA